MLEYVLIAVVIALIAIFVTYRFSGSVGGRWKSSASQLEATKANEESSASGVVARSESGPAAGGPGSAPPEPTPIEATAPSDGKVHVGNFAFDFSTILWLGLGLLAVTVIIAVRVFSAAATKDGGK